MVGSLGEMGEMSRPTEHTHFIPQLEVETALWEGSHEGFGMKGRTPTRIILRGTTDNAPPLKLPHGDALIFQHFPQG